MGTGEMEFSWRSDQRSLVFLLTLAFGRDGVYSTMRCLLMDNSISSFALSMVDVSFS